MYIPVSPHPVSSFPLDPLGYTTTPMPCRYYGLMAQRFCYINRSYQEIFEDCFVKQYQLIHRLETNKLRNVAKLFAHLLSTDAISWAVLQAVRITEDDTTSSSRIFIKVLFQVCCAGRWCWL